MADYVIDGGILTDIADAIRQKTHGSGVIVPEDMASEIAGISGGGSRIYTCTKGPRLAGTPNVIVTGNHAILEGRFETSGGSAWANTDIICTVPSEIAPSGVVYAYASNGGTYSYTNRRLKLDHTGAVTYDTSGSVYSYFYARFECDIPDETVDFYSFDPLVKSISGKIAIIGNAFFVHNTVILNSVSSGWANKNFITLPFMYNDCELVNQPQFRSYYRDDTSSPYSDYCLDAVINTLSDGRIGLTPYLHSTRDGFQYVVTCSGVFK